MSILDIKAQDTTGRWYNIEMQINEDLNFAKRAIYYWAKLVTDQLSEGMMFRDLEKTISINILDFDFVPDDEFHSLYKIVNTRTGIDDKLHDVFELHYIELRKFRKEFDELVAPLDRWITFLTRAPELKQITLPESMAKDEKIVKAIHAVDRMFDEEERQVYVVRMEDLAKAESTIVSAREKGLAEGRKEGLEKGLQEGREEERKKLVANLLDILDNSTIAEKTGFTLNEIQKLRTDNGK